MQHMTLVFQPTPRSRPTLDQLLIEQQDPLFAELPQVAHARGIRRPLRTGTQDVKPRRRLAAARRASPWTRSRAAAPGLPSAASRRRSKPPSRPSIHNYLVDGKMHYARRAEPSIPAAFAGVVTGIGALHDFAPHSRSVKARPRLTSSITGNHFVLPGDFATIYDLQDAVQQRHQWHRTDDRRGGPNRPLHRQQSRSQRHARGHREWTATAVRCGDVPQSRWLARADSSNFQTVICSRHHRPGVVTTDVDEANLDVEWSGAIAPNANADVRDRDTAANNGDGAFGALQYAVDNIRFRRTSSASATGSANRRSTPPRESYLTMAGQQANAQGQTIVAPSGDSGAADCDSTLPATLGPRRRFPGEPSHCDLHGGNDVFRGLRQHQRPECGDSILGRVDERHHRPRRWPTFPRPHGTTRHRRYYTSLSPAVEASARFPPSLPGRPVQACPTTASATCPTFRSVRRPIMTAT